MVGTGPLDFCCREAHLKLHNKQQKDCVASSTTYNIPRFISGLKQNYNLSVRGESERAQSIPRSFPPAQIVLFFQGFFQTELRASYCMDNISSRGMRADVMPMTTPSFSDSGFAYGSCAVPESGLSC